jgi:hypothetical protein
LIIQESVLQVNSGTFGAFPVGDIDTLWQPYQHRY